MAADGSLFMAECRAWDSAGAPEAPLTVMAAQAGYIMITTVP